MTSVKTTMAEAWRTGSRAVGWSVLAANTALLGTTCIGVSLFDPDGRRAFYVGKTWARMNLALIRCSVTAIGQDKIEPDQPYVLMSNHRSHVDVWALFAAVPLQIRWIMKRELRQVPVFGYACERMGHIYIQRGDRAEALAGMAAAAERIRAGTSVHFFAEGTRSRDGTIGPFKKGGFRLALQAEVPILPIGIAGSERILPADEWRYRGGAVTVVIGDPIPTAGLGADALEDLMARTRTAIEDALAQAEPRRPSSR